MEFYEETFESQGIQALFDWYGNRVVRQWYVFRRDRVVVTVARRKSFFNQHFAGCIKHPWHRVVAIDWRINRPVGQATCLRYQRWFSQSLLDRAGMCFIFMDTGNMAGLRGRFPAVYGGAVLYACRQRAGS